MFLLGRSAGKIGPRGKDEKRKARKEKRQSRGGKGEKGGETLLKARVRIARETSFYWKHVSRRRGRISRRAR